jgi:hypothetical protein
METENQPQKKDKNKNKNKNQEANQGSDEEVPIKTTETQPELIKIPSFKSVFNPPQLIELRLVNCKGD